MKIRFSKSGIHLFDRNSGNNILIDEITVPETLWSQAPRHVSIALTNACDLACSYCYASKKGATLNFEHIKSWLHEMDRNGTLGVGFGGGEPTLHKHFVDICSYASSTTSLAVSFTTHGHHVSDKVLGELYGKVHFIRVSLDGLHETYERLRGRSFKMVKERICAIEKKIPFGINYVVNDDTLPDLYEAINFAESVGASEFLLLPEYRRTEEAAFSTRILNSIKGLVEMNTSSMPLRISELCSEGLPVCDPFASESSLSSYAHVDAEGVLKRTSYDLNGIKITADGFMKGLQKLSQEIENIKNKK